jgi:hypothetical protein
MDESQKQLAYRLAAIILLVCAVYATTLTTVSSGMTPI